MSRSNEFEPSRTVLIVDDERDVRTVARIMLERAGYNVVEAANGREAVESLRTRPGDVDVVLLDIMMPEMGGREALPALRAVVPTLPVVFFSGYDRNEVASALEPEGPHTSFIAKPFSKADLISEIERAVST